MKHGFVMSLALLCVTFADAKASVFFAVLLLLVRVDTTNVGLCFSGITGMYGLQSYTECPLLHSF